MHDVLHHAVDIVLVAILGYLFWLLERRQDRREALEKQREAEWQELRDRLREVEISLDIERKHRKGRSDHD